MKSYFLYKFENKINGKVYIGITSRPKERRREHFSKSSKCTKLRRAIRKYGKENFEFTILCEGSEDYIVELEVKAINAYDSINSGYNVFLGHPNDDGVGHTEYSKKRISEGLIKYYSENVCKNLGAVRESIRDNSAYYISGFWFPDRRVAMKALRMNEKTFYKRRSEGTLGDTCHPQKKSVCHSPVYILGFWFDTLITASHALNKDIHFLQHLLRKKDVEEEMKVVGTKPRTKSKDAPIGVNVRENGRFRTVMTFNKKKVLDRTFESEYEAMVAFDDSYETYHGTRPNNTKRE